MYEILRAYSVQSDETGCVVFAASGVVARREGAQELGCDFEDIESCRLAPEFDNHAPGPVPIAALIEAGWWYHCGGCSKKVHEDDECEDGSPAVPFYPDEGNVYCSRDCYDSAMAERAERKRTHDEMVEQAQAKWPGIRVVGSWEFTNPPSMSFTFPGGEHAVNWNAGQTHVTLNGGDEAAWHTYRASLGREVAA